MPPPSTQTYQVYFYLQNVANHASFSYISKPTNHAHFIWKKILFSREGVQGVPLCGKFHENRFIFNPRRRKACTKSVELLLGGEK